MLCTPCGISVRKGHVTAVDGWDWCAVNVWDKIGWLEGRLSVKGLTGAHRLPTFCAELTHYAGRCAPC